MKRKDRKPGCPRLVPFAGWLLRFFRFVFPWLRFYPLPSFPLSLRFVRCSIFISFIFIVLFGFFLFWLPRTVALLPVAAGALAFVRWAAGGHGQQCIVSGFHFFVFFLLPRGRSFRFLSFYLPPRRRAGAGA